MFFVNYKTIQLKKYTKSDTSNLVEYTQMI